ncbi:MAG: hypothetical protein CFE21_04890 [Bacteroidetes bacterium B1(2017)]|nr:MAG: hypothetical protein CFE21_04890 [Bacteroidetes bacterium B1(2017)]
MKSKSLLIVLVILLSTILQAQPGTVNFTPKQELIDGPLVKKTLIVPSKFKGLIDTTYTVNLPSSYQASVFYIGGLSKPRVLEISPKGVLHVIDYKNNGSIYALPDKNNDDVADSLIPVVTGVNAHCFKFYQNNIYVAEETRILKCSDLDLDGFFETKETLIDSIGLRGNHIGGGHTTRTILIDEINNKLYVSIGSSANVVRDQGRALIEQYNLDGTGRKVFATGIRNAVGMAFDPIFGNLWANNNGSDQQGNNIPPEWISVIEDSGFYGYPFAYGNQVWFNMEAHADYRSIKPITLADTLLVNTMQEPGGLIQAHSAPMELEYSHDAYPKFYTGFFTTLHGSWNRTPATGYKLIYLKIDPGMPYKKITSYTDFMTGFLTDSITRSYWARPVGLAIQERSFQKPDIYISSDAGNTFVLKLTCVGGLTPCDNTIGINETNKKEINAYPNPFHTEIYLSSTIEDVEQVCLINTLGVAQIIDYNKINHKLTVPEIAAGIYLLQVKTTQGVYIQKVLHQE